MIPCYRSEKTVEKVIDEIRSVVGQRKEYDYEIICVNDCSPDMVYSVLEDLADRDPKIKVVNLSKNMGKHAALLAGYSYVNGEYIVNIDDDYQCPTPELWKLLEPVASGEYDVSTASYHKKQEAGWKRIGSNVNARIGEILLNKPKGLRFENFCILRRFVVDEMVKYTNAFPFLEGLILQVTRRIIMIEMEERSRGDENSSGFTFIRSLQLFSNGFTAFSVIPLRISTFLGFIVAFTGFLMGLFLVIRRLMDPGVLIGYTSTIVLLLFLGGMILMCLGILGEYVGRIYICINRAPQYVVRNTINL